MILSVFGEPTLTNDMIVDFGIRTLTFLLMGLIFPLFKPYLNKLAKVVRPYSTFLSEFLVNFSNSYILNHGPVIRIVCCLVLIISFSLVK